MKRIGLLLKEMKIKRLEKELVGLEDGFEKANIEFELRLLKNSLKENKNGYKGCYSSIMCNKKGE